MRMSLIPENIVSRHRGAYDFETHYCNQCALQDTVPLIEVKAHLQQGVLDINSDKIRLGDWPPILNTLRINKSLRFIAIRSFYSQSVDKDGRVKKSHYFKRRPPAIRSKDLTLRLSQVIGECLKVTENLKCLDLQGIPFREKDLISLAKGLNRNSTITHLSLEYCCMGDVGCEIISESVKHHSALSHLNYSGCNLTWKSSETIAKLIKHQSTERHSEAWVDSLRYRQPNLDSMTGLRRITLNSNPMIGDEGMSVLADALKDDLWLKALDLQKCGIGRNGGNVLLEMLKQNKTLMVLDIRFNPLIDRHLLHGLLGQVLINSNGYDEKDFPWIAAEPPKDPYHTRPRRRSKQIGSGYGKKTTIKLGSRASPKLSRPPESDWREVSPGNKGFVPWRTAYRASQYKMVYNTKEKIGTPRYLQNAEIGHVTIQVEESESEEDDNEDVPLSLASPERASSKQRDLMPASPVTVAIKSYDQKIRRMKIDVLEARRSMMEERKARQLAEQHALNLEVDNERLKRELVEERAVNGMQSVLDDESLLESIETSFNKFHSFLDLLKQLGLGGLVAYAGMSDMQFPLGKNDKKSSESGKPTLSHKLDEGRGDSQYHSKKLTKKKSYERRDDSEVEPDEVSAPPPITFHSKTTSREGKQKNTETGEVPKQGSRASGRQKTQESVDKSGASDDIDNDDSTSNTGAGGDGLRSK